MQYLASKMPKKQILDHLKHKAETSGTRALPESRAPPAELLLGLFD